MTDQSKEKKCPICLEPFKKTNLSITDCGHKFCTSCLLNSIKTNNCCPICRNKLVDPIKTNKIADVVIEITSDVYQTIDIDMLLQELNISQVELYELMDKIINLTITSAEIHLDNNNQTNNHSVIVEDLIDTMN